MCIRDSVSHKSSGSERARQALSKLKADLDEVWIALDQDPDGTVTKAELKAALTRKGTANDTRVRKLLERVGGKGEQGAFTVLEALDEDGDGRVSKKEFYESFLLEANLLDVFTAADTDDDGAAVHLW
eukprot:TRINITY_DN27907_c0_g1_i1.p3 TRINITY_DN27907_c0_g1~~TRINITY_DN27907_c0_g1_i1.p3  ORF type:complete len:128 (-),score=53.52 TRINITY_DN27907_c0_g1_i1:353-736(-)